MIVRTVRSKHLISMTVVAVCLAAAYPPVVASQETKKEAELCRISSDTALPCPSPAPRKEIPETRAQQAANLPDAPQAQVQSSPSNSSPIPQDNTRALLFLPVATSSQRLSFSDKFTIYAHQTFGPPAVILPAFSAGMGMASPLLRVDLNGAAQPLWHQSQANHAWGYPSPDGRHLAIMRSSTESNVWVINNF